VDFAFFVKARPGAEVLAPGFVPIDGNGISVTPPLLYQFDARRTFRVIQALLASGRAEIQWVFVARHLTGMMLEAAERDGVPAAVRERAGRFLKQPRGKAHWDHLHVRIRCPDSDRPTCVDHGASRAPRDT